MYSKKNQNLKELSVFIFTGVYTYFEFYTALIHHIELCINEPVMSC